MKKHSTGLDPAAGGKARAESLSAEERQEIARYAAAARWSKGEGDMPKETHPGVLRIGGRELPCSVLDNGLRVFSAGGVSAAVGSRKKSADSTAENGAPRMPAFLAAPKVRPFIPNDLIAPLISPIEFRPKRGGRSAYGYEATLLPRICEVILDAAKAGAIRTPSVIAAAELLMRGFAHVGIIALVDEATGYQSERARDELNKILEAYISPELLPWTARFPDEFFRQIYRLEGWKFQEGNHKRPRQVGKTINRLVYEPLPPGVLDELRRINPPGEKGYRRYKHHQFMTAEIGNPHLSKQIIEVTTLMRVAENKTVFQSLFQKAFPKKHEQLRLQLEYDSSRAEG